MHMHTHAHAHAHTHTHAHAELLGILSVDEPITGRRPSGDEIDVLVAVCEHAALAVQAGIGPGVAVLDLCCGIAGPGRFVTRELGCDYLGVDASASAVARPSPLAAPVTSATRPANRLTA